MKTQTRRKPRARRKLVGGKWYHVYRVVVEQTRHQSIVIEAKSQDEAESQACDIAERHPEGWRDGDAEVRDCTSAEMADGSWKPCNAPETDV